jgi:hypothetical protein
VKALLISCCCFVDVLQLSHEYRKAEPGMFNLLFGGERFWQAAAVREAVSCTDMESLVERLLYCCLSAKACVVIPPPRAGPPANLPCQHTCCRCLLLWFPAAYGFPVGLSMCVINGASLFTSNIAYMMAAYIQRKSSAAQGLYVIVLSYFMNFAGRC